MAHVQLFLSTVSAEFRSYREALRRPLTRPNVSVAVQEDFIPTGTETLDKLDDYIRACHAVIHLVGDMTGALAQPLAVASIHARYPDLPDRLPPLRPFLAAGASPMSYTQWEAYLAIYHRKTLIIATPDGSAPRDARYVLDPVQRHAQQDHLRRLRESGRYPEINFASEDKLAIEILRSALHDILVAAGSSGKPINLPYPSLESLFKGRGYVLDQIRENLQRAGDGRATAIVGKALHGLGGVGKTRLAIEYAWRNADQYTALLFITADAPDALQRTVAALCDDQVLDLPEQQMPEELARVAAVLHWLQVHPGWLLILDNIDTPAAGVAAEKLLARLHGGHVLLTGRLSSWSGGVQALELDTIAPEDARDLLLARTETRRRKTPDDAAHAQALAEELGRLALALEQAGAYIAHHRLTLAAYLAEWRDHRERVLGWFDERVMQYPRSVAITWQTSVDQLSTLARGLLHRLAWLAPEPIPESLLDVAVPDSPDAGDPLEALAELETYSLVTRSADRPTFSVHRLVQEVTRLGLKANTGNEALAQALGWINDTFVGDPEDVRHWPILNPLVPHALAVAYHADDAAIAAPTSRLMNQLGCFLASKALHAEAEPLYRQALKIDESSYGPDHPDVAIRLNNLADLLRATNRFTEAEPLFRRALKIGEASYGPDHPTVAARLNNLAELLRATNRHTEAEPLYRRALKIDERNYGPDHPDVARDLNNLALLLRATNRLAEAEPLYRRALKIVEASYGSDHPRVAILLNNLVRLLRETNRLAEAESLDRRALKIVEASYGTDHPHVAIPLNSLAGLLRATNRHTEAEPLYRRALKIDETSYGLDHPTVATLLNDLAELLRETNRHTEAEPLYRRALKIDERSYGPDHPDVARDLNNLALLLRATNRLAEAEPLHRRALKIVEASYGPDHPDVAMLLNNLAGLLRDTNRLAEAEPLYRLAVTIF